MELINAQIRTRLMLAKAFLEQGETELARIQLQLIKKERAQWLSEKTLIMVA